MTTWEPVIGLEVHAELATNTKLFCACPTEFGAEPNTLVCPRCLGMPGTLPVLNKRALEFAIRAALAFDCQITERMIFVRKNYFYPDLPKGYQISQLGQPVGTGGRVNIVVDGLEKQIHITRIQLEEEAGKSIHGGATIRESTFSMEDFNRCGIPLIEIISEPEMNSVDEAKAYLEKLKTVLLYIGVSDCKMEEGSLRCDVNISMREKGTNRLGPHAEIKNLNSFRAVVNVLEYEIQRQTELMNSGGVVVRETRTWDEGRGVSLSMRSKEEAHDYRFFPEPDLVPVEPGQAWIDEIKATLPELPDVKRRRYVEEYGLPLYDAELISGNRAMADFFEQTLRYYKDAKAISNWLMGEVSRLNNQAETGFEELRFSPQQLGDLLAMIDNGKISTKIAKTVLEEMFASGTAPETIVAERGLMQISDQGALEAMIKSLVEANPGPAEDFRNGREKALGFFVGQIMKETKGRANPVLVTDLLKEAILGKK
ncbi:MAG: Asp-tRNA(Asn)/Glu-tRNA(Gln) amidotransferase subunit GatB [Bacillota bacterium]|jgi:aspartyl-tRNA(Asn)/glutamyl-tRNA(Gln) amidotransferase subunit B